MKKWMNRMFDYKNRVISKLLDELEEAEEQYSYNFQSHSSHISNIIGKYTVYNYLLIFNYVFISLKGNSISI